MGTSDAVSPQTRCGPLSRLRLSSESRYFTASALSKSLLPEDLSSMVSIISTSRPVSSILKFLYSGSSLETISLITDKNFKDSSSPIELLISCRAIVVWPNLSCSPEPINEYFSYSWVLTILTSFSLSRFKITCFASSTGYDLLAPVKSINSLPFDAAYTIVFSGLTLTSTIPGSLRGADVTIIGLSTFFTANRVRKTELYID